MRSTVYTLLAAAAVASAQTSEVTPAPAVTDLPIGRSYIAVLPEADGKKPQGSVIGTTSPDGKGVVFQVSISNLPETSLGPFMYHIHEKPVPANGSCAGTGAHLDPYKRGELTPCDADAPETCQTGDLAGKFGNFTAQSGSAEYTDLYSSTEPGTPAFFGDLSIVFHTNNKTRIACANFTLKESGGSKPSSGYALPTGGPGPIKNSTSIPSGTGSTPSPTSTPPTYTSPAPSQPPPPQSTGGASKLSFAGAGLLAAAVALLF